MQLDVSVLDKDRRPVRGLTMADFRVFEDGQPQEIAIFESVDVPDPGPLPAVWMRDVAPDVVTNEDKGSRLFVLAVDDALIPNDSSTIKSSKQIVRSIIDKLGPDDLAAVVFTGDNRQAQDFTNDRTKLLATLDRFSPGLASWKIGPAAMNQDLQFYLASVNTLRNVMEALVAVPHGRKTLVWVTPGIPVDLAASAPARATQPNDPSDKSMVERDVHLRLNDLTREVFEVARRANVAIYPVDPCGLAGLEAIITGRVGSPRDPRLPWVRSEDDLLMTAANTGGHAVVKTNDFEPGIDQIFRENSSYYVIGYTLRNTNTEGRLRAVNVKVDRPGVTVMARSGYYAPKPAGADPKSASTALATAVAAPVPMRDLPMRASVAPFARPGSRNAAIAIVLGIRQLVPESAAKARVAVTTELRTDAFTNDGDPRGTQRHTAKVVLRAGAQGDADYEALSRIDLPPGRYRLRMAAYLEAANKIGSVMADVVVPDFGRDVASISGIVLGAVPGRPSAPHDLLTGILSIVPTSQRVFVRTDRVTALFDLYQSGAAPVVAANVAVRIVDGLGNTRITDTVPLAADRFVMFGAPPVPDTVNITGGSTTARSASLPPERPDRFVNDALRHTEVQYRVPLDRLSPGMYLLTFEAAVGSMALRRDVQFSVR